MDTPPRARGLWAPVGAYMACIFVFSSLPPSPAVTDGNDKSLHVLVYAGLSALVVRAFAGGWRRRVTLGAAVGAVAIATVYGVTDELHQSFVPSRQMDVLDVVSDAIGAAVAACILYARRFVPGPPRGRVHGEGGDQTRGV